MNGIICVVGQKPGLGNSTGIINAVKTHAYLSPQLNNVIEKATFPLARALALSHHRLRRELQLTGCLEPRGLTQNQWHVSAMSPGPPWGRA